MAGTGMARKKMTEPKTPEGKETAPKLPTEEQGELPPSLEDEKRWEEAFSSSSNRLENLANEALNEHRSGRTEPFDPDKL